MGANTLLADLFRTRPLDECEQSVCTSNRRLDHMFVCVGGLCLLSCSCVHVAFAARVGLAYESHVILQYQCRAPPIAITKPAVSALVWCLGEMRGRTTELLVSR